jgi:hypothetical protein
MPERAEHHDLCQRCCTLPRRNNSECPLDLCRSWDRPPKMWCPLDGLIRDDGKKWHDFHLVKRVLGKGCYPKTPPQTDGQVIWPEIDDSVARIQRALDNLEPSFIDFARRLPDVPSEETRFCWKAHLVADFGFSFCWEAAQWHTKKHYYRTIRSKAPSLWDEMCGYVTQIYHAIR